MDLFVSDLDGTLLTSEQTLSQNTIAIINKLIREGIAFTIATARSIDSAGPILAPLALQLPVIVNNGVFAYDILRKTDVWENFLPLDVTAELLEVIRHFKASPFIFTDSANHTHAIYYTSISNAGEAHYYNGRISRGDRRFRQVDHFILTPEEPVITLVIIGEWQNIEPLYQEISKKFDLTLHFSQDIYSKAYWLEISHPMANKQEAVRRLKSLLGAERLICFGDHLNDCSMFEVADERLAVVNAHPDLKRLADQIIGHHDDDGVARFLEKRFPLLLHKKA